VGYRSDVAYTIRFDDSDKGRQTFEIFLADARQNEETKGAFNDSEGDEPALKIDMVNRQINFYADQVKWYPDYADVKCHDALFTLAREYIDDMADLDNQVCCMGAIFTIIGETLNDIVEECHGEYDWRWLGVSRSIERDWE
jgi:hypothetical protein